MSTFDITVHGETKTFFQSERASVNLLLCQIAKESQVSLASDWASIRQTVRHSMSKMTFGDNVVADDLLRQLAWPTLSTPPLQDVHSSLGLSTSIEVLISPCELNYTVEDIERKLAQQQHEMLARDLTTQLEEISAVAGNLFPTASLGIADICRRLHDIVTCRTFVYAKHEIAKLMKQVQELMSEQQTVRASFEGCLQNDQIQEAEEFAQTELTILERLLEVCRQLVAAGVSTAADANDFFNTLEILEKDADSASTSMKSYVTQLQSSLRRDATVVADSQQTETNRFRELSAALSVRQESLISKSRELISQRAALWREIESLLLRDESLAQEQDGLLTDRMELVREQQKHEAEHKSFSEGLAAVASALQSRLLRIADATQFESIFETHVDAMIATADNKGIDDEATALRRAQQFQYLDTYTQYALASTALRHRKETRNLAAERLIRNLQLQVDASKELLDSRKSAYQSELEGLIATSQRVEKEIDRLRQKLDHECALWKPVQQQLEEEDVAFEPPDMVVNKHLLQLKSDAVKIVRDFVLAEQDAVDKETIHLRKMDVASKVAREQLEQRRHDRETHA